MVVDGAPVPEAVLTLSHWPGTPTPPELAADTSAEIAFHYLDDGRSWPDADIVTNDHFDEDGLVAAFVLAEPEEAIRRRELLCDVARAGDFGTFDDRRAARVSFAIGALADPSRSLLPSSSLRWAERTPGLYKELIGRFADLADHTDRYRDLWADEDEMFQLSEERVNKGHIAIEEMGDLDLAVVTVLDDQEPAGTAVASPTNGGGSAFHPSPVHNRTDASLLAVIKGRRYELRYRYESWVRMASRRPRPRVDLSVLAEALNEEEPDGRRWVFDGAWAVTPSMRLVGLGQNGERREAGAHGSSGSGRPVGAGRSDRALPPESALSPERFLELTTRYVVSAPAAFDPYAVAPAG